MSKLEIVANDGTAANGGTGATGGTEAMVEQ